MREIKKSHAARQFSNETKTESSTVLFLTLSVYQDSQRYLAQDFHSNRMFDGSYSSECEFGNTRFHRYPAVGGRQRDTGQSSSFL